MMRRMGGGWQWPLTAVFSVLALALSGPVQAQPRNTTPRPTIRPSIPPAATGSDPTSLRVPITTADGVELDGTYFRSPKIGRDAPCVILVHRYGLDRSKSDWTALARRLQEAGFAVLTFDLRGHGGSTQISNPDVFWRVPYNRMGIYGGMNSTRKSTLNFADFKPSYLPFLVNDVAAARRFFEQKNDAGEVNVHSLIIIGAEAGADLGFLFTAAEYSRIYRIGVMATQSNGTPYNAGDDIAAAVWLSLSARPAAPAGAPSFPFVSWIRSHPRMRERTAMSFIFGDKDVRSKSDSELAYRTLTGSIGPDKHKLDVLYPIRGTDLAGPALLGQSTLQTTDHIVNFCNKVMADRRAIPWTEVKWESNPFTLVPLQQFGFRAP